VSKQKWLITGGAGYIGTHIADLFITSGKDVVLLDSLYQGLESRVDYLRTKHKVEIPLKVIDLRDYSAVDALLAEYSLPASFTQQLLRQLVNQWKSRMSTKKLTTPPLLSY
jgi:UDP-glucose 4-epimerase